MICACRLIFWVSLGVFPTWTLTLPGRQSQQPSYTKPPFWEWLEHLPAGWRANHKSQLAGWFSMEFSKYLSSSMLCPRLELVSAVHRLKDREEPPPPRPLVRVD